MSHHPDVARTAAFCEKHNLRVPILMAPMASACPASLAIAVANAGGLGGCGALLMQQTRSTNGWQTFVQGLTGAFNSISGCPIRRPSATPPRKMRSGVFSPNGDRRSRQRPVMSSRPTLRRSARQCWRLDQRSSLPSWAYFLSNLSLE